MDDPRTPPTAAAAEEPLHPPAQPQQISTGKGVKETIESILIAFILAFVFRAFVVEAFVIPTGSMATTLLGAHMRFTCKECGYRFDVNYPGSGSNEDVPAKAVDSEGRPLTYRAICPNCRYRVSGGEETGPDIRYGDRILVLKYLYIPWISSPHRWDVVVFKTPTSVEGAPLYTTNYIKRLIGVPGDWVMLLDGDVYVCHDSKYAHLDPEDAIRSIPPTAWEIQTKPKHAQDALWRIVYDHDYRPLDKNRTDGWRLPWVHNDDDGWETGDKASRVFAFKNASAGGVLRFDPTTIPNYRPQEAKGGYFTDWIAYDETMQQSGYNADYAQGYATYTVSDFKLAFTYDRKEGDGVLRAKLTKHFHGFNLELHPDRVELVHWFPNGDKASIPPIAAFDPRGAHGPIRVEFENVDYRVTVRLNDRVVYQTTREQYHPNVADLLARYQRRGERMFEDNPTVHIEAGRQTAALSHVSLWRDVYYTPEDSRSRSEITHGRPTNPVKLGGDEYFVMGDNSAASSDARFWTQSVDIPEERLHAESGRVPGRFMLGRAFFVYWPAGYRPMRGAPALVPNFGDMRLIQ
jgi:signal peptidase I